MRYAIGFVSAVCGSLAFVPSARAATWNEATQGDISGDRQNPSRLALTPGTNTFSGTTAGGDLDYLRLDVPAGGRIQSLTLRNYTSPDSTAFIAIQQGTAFTEPAGNPNPSNLLGYSHFGPGNLNVNLLPNMGTPPLTGANYTLWIQQLGSLTTYSFEVVATPEPTGAAVVSALAAFTCLRRRRRQTSI